MYMNFLSRLWKLNKNWFIGSIVLVGLTILINSLKSGKGIGFSAAIGTGLLILSIVPANIWRIFNWPFLKTLNRYRRDFGITAGLLFFTHVNLAVIKYLQFPLTEIPNISFVLGIVANYAMILLLLTSPFFVKKFLRGSWKYIHSLVWFLIPLALSHSILVVKLVENSWSVVGIIGFGGLFIFGLTKFLLPKQDLKDSIRDLIFLTLGIILALVLIGINVETVKSVLKIGESNSVVKSDLVSSEVSSMVKNSSKISQADLASNNSSNSCWVSYLNVVYNMTDYVKSHPGGKSMLKSCGRDIAYLENSHEGPPPSSQQFKSILDSRKIGEL
jgi:DMSO/TMAO reductase YedYZ heme-binding membrane subunit